MTVGHAGCVSEVAPPQRDVTLRPFMTRARARRDGIEALYPRGFWPAISVPGVLWLVALFVVPFYAIVATAAGRLHPIFGTSVPEWNPLYWQPGAFAYVLNGLASPVGIFREVFLRTLGYVLLAVGLCLLRWACASCSATRSPTTCRGCVGACATCSSC